MEANEAVLNRKLAFFSADCQSVNQLQPIRLLCTNCRSAKGKRTELSSLTTDYDIIGLTETHLDDSINSRFIISRSDLTFARKDRNRYGGGVMIAVCYHLNPEILDVPYL